MHWSLFCLLAAVALVGQLFAFKKLLLLGTPVLLASWLFLLVGGVVTLLFWALMGGEKTAALSFSPSQFLWLAAAGLSVAFINLGHFWAFEAGGFLAFVSLTVSAMATLVAVALGALFLGEALTLTSAAGIVLALTGVALMVKG
jgi:uncharacterized membrane protein